MRLIDLMGVMCGITVDFRESNPIQVLDCQTGAHYRPADFDDEYCILGGDKENPFQKDSIYQRTISFIYPSDAPGKMMEIYLN